MLATASNSYRGLPKHLQEFQELTENLPPNVFHSWVSMKIPPGGLPSAFHRFFWGSKQHSKASRRTSRLFCSGAAMSSITSTVLPSWALGVCVFCSVKHRLSTCANNMLFVLLGCKQKGLVDFLQRKELFRSAAGFSGFSVPSRSQNLLPKMIKGMHI